MMKWETLLNSLRTRELCGGSPSLRSEGDPRTEFERDYGRSIFSTPVRRLQDKAQVFPLEQHDYIRTRLTHSVEVSSVGRSLSGKVAEWLVESGEISAKDARAIEEVAATCGILHDIGNPPFGHAGEQAIRDWFRKNVGEDVLKKDTQGSLDFLHWDGNAQTIRLVAKLQLLSDEFGLNLTCGTLSAACKYIAPSNAIDKRKHEWSKLGFFASEQELINQVQDATGTVGIRNPITYLVEASDDIVYSAVDLEDAVKKRLLTWEPLKDRLVSSARTNHHCNTAIQKAEQKIGRAVTGSMREESLVQAFRTYAINEAVVSVLSEFKSRYDAIMRGEYHGQLVDDCSAAPLITTCKNVAREFVYRSKEILATELLGRKVISDLLSAFWEGARECDANSDHKNFPAKAYLLMSSNYRKVFEDNLLATGGSPDIPVVYRRLQLVCDYIAGMTDSFACRIHKSLTNG